MYQRRQSKTNAHKLASKEENPEAVKNKTTIEAVFQILLTIFYKREYQNILGSRSKCGLEKDT